MPMTTRKYTCKGCNRSLEHTRLPVDWFFVATFHDEDQSKVGFTLVCSADCVWKRARRTT